MDPSLSREQCKISGCAGGLQYWTAEKEANEIDLRNYIATKWDPEGIVYALIREFHEDVHALQKRATYECQEIVLEAIEKARPAINSATQLVKLYGKAKNPLTLAEKYEWKKMFRWLHANLFVDIRPSVHEWITSDDLTCYLEDLRRIRQVVQRGYLIENFRLHGLQRGFP